MAKKKRTVTKTTSAPKKQTPAMYPTPAAIELATPQKIVAIDLKTKTITIEGSPPPEVLAMVEIERRRLNLVERITGYTKTLAIRIAPHWGERPKHISPAKWKNLEQRIKAMAELPETAPAEARDALMALQTLNRMAADLAEAGDWPDSIDRALCYAIDFGQLLQRGQTQIDHGETVDKGRRNAEAVAGATEAQHTKKNGRSEAAHTEFLRRMATVKGTRRKTDTLTKMSKEMNADGQPKYGSLRTLIRYAEHWKSVTPSE